MPTTSLARAGRLAGRRYSAARIVLEVDGKHHYPTGTLADPSVYAATMRGHRAFKLARYDVFRFGAADLDQ